MDNRSYFTVDKSSGEIRKRRPSNAGDNGNADVSNSSDADGNGIRPAVSAHELETITIDDLPENVAIVDSFDWQWYVFWRRPRMAMFLTVLFSIPLLFGAFVMYQTVFHSLVILSPWLTPVIFPVYWALDRSSTRAAYVITQTEQDGLLIDEQLWWRWDYWKMPEQTKFNRYSGRNAEKAKMTNERLVWLDARNPQKIKAFRPNQIPMVFDLIADESKKKSGDGIEYVTSANIIGQEAYNQSAYLFAKLTPNADFFGRNAPWLLLLGGSFLGIFLGAGRIASMMGVQ